MRKRWPKLAAIQKKTCKSKPVLRRPSHRKAMAQNGSKRQQRVKLRRHFVRRSGRALPGWPGRQFHSKQPEGPAERTSARLLRASRSDGAFQVSYRRRLRGEGHHENQGMRAAFF